jgi:hypothetical protein
MESGADIHEDGLHFTGGSRIVIANCDIECGDDCIAFNFDPLELRVGHKDMTDVTIANCVLFSHRANAIRLLVDNPDDPDPPLIATEGPRIHRVAITNIIAKCGDAETDPEKNKGAGIDISDNNNQQRITDVDITNFQLDASQAVMQPLTILSAERVRLSRVTIRDPTLRSSVDNARDVELVDCVIDMRATATADQQCLLVGDNNFPGAIDSTNIRIRGGSYRGATHHGIQLGATKAVTGFEVSGALISGAKLDGLSIFKANDGIVSANRITGNVNWGIRELIPSNENLFIANYLDDNGQGLNYEGPLSSGVRNIGPGRDVEDSGGFRETPNGWHLDSVQPNMSNVELERHGMAVGANRFIAPRAGSIIGIVVSSTEDVGAGSVKVEVYRTTGGVPARAPLNPATMATGLTATLVPTPPGPSRRAFATRREGQIQFDPGDEITIVVTTDSAFFQTLMGIEVALQITQ